jgi:hypothetical protein
MNVIHQIIIYLPTFQTNSTKINTFETYVFQTHITQKKFSLPQQGIKKSNNKKYFLFLHPCFLFVCFFPSSSLKNKK